jgi:hypothetical protein
MVYMRGGGRYPNKRSEPIHLGIHYYEVVLARYYEEVSVGLFLVVCCFIMLLFLSLRHRLTNYIYFPFGLELLS